MSQPAKPATRKTKPVGKIVGKRKKSKRSVKLHTHDLIYIGRDPEYKIWFRCAECGEVMCEEAIWDAM